MKKHLSLAIFLAFTMLTACGGGGGGGGGATYTGSTSPAELTATNVDVIAKESIQVGSMGSMGNISFSKPGGESLANGPLYATLAKMARDAAQVNYATETFSDTISGDCGGSASFTMTIDDVTYDFSGSMTFNNYCLAGTIMSGSVSFTGSVNQNTNELTMTMTLKNISGQSMGESYTLSGTIKTVIGSTSATMTMDLVVKDNVTSKVYKMENYTLSVSGSYVDISGRFYYPDYGYVTISTPTAFYYPYGASYPSQGVMVMTGANNVTAKMTISNSTQYTLEVDLNGDGDYTDTDESVGTFTWT